LEEIVELTVEAFRNDDNGLAQKVEPLEGWSSTIWS
jgi:hypothetical protein